MNNTEYFVIGLMSGTSLDGLDIAYCHFQNQSPWKYEILSAETISYDQDFRKILEYAESLNAIDFISLDRNFGKFLGEQVNAFVKKHQITHVDFIASHGHTIFHQPDKGFTCQIGHGATIAATTGLKVVCDFRSLDVANGGQGAPLVPIGDQLLFTDYHFCLNLGGFSNISFEKEYGRRIAYDICPVNIVLNHLASQIGFIYDSGGDIARQAEMIPSLFSDLENLPYYHLSAPKSLGKEWVEACIFPLLSKYQSYRVEDLIATFTLHVATRIAAEINENCNLGSRVLLTGGGGFNTYLIELIKQMAQAEVILPADLIVNFKEALIFAFLGVLRVEGIDNCLSSVTGAYSNSCSGAIYLPCIKI